MSVLLCPQIQEGMVVYVCFFHGATEEVTREMGEFKRSLDFGVEGKNDKNKL